MCINAGNAPPLVLFFHRLAWGADGAPDILVPKVPPYRPIALHDDLHLYTHDAKHGSPLNLVTLTHARELDTGAVEFVAVRHDELFPNENRTFLLRVDRVYARLGLWTRFRFFARRVGERATTVARERIEAAAALLEQFTTRPKPHTQPVDLPRSSVERLRAHLIDLGINVGPDKSPGFGVIRITEETRVVSTVDTRDGDK